MLWAGISAEVLTVRLLCFGFGFGELLLISDVLTRSSQLATHGTMINKKKKFDIQKTPDFDDWLDGVKDAQGKAAILGRLDRAGDGNFGDCEPVGEGMSEMRVFVGPGYRIYFVRSGQTEYLMLSGSDKTDQKRGIKRAKAILDALRGN